MKPEENKIYENKTEFSSSDAFKWFKVQIESINLFAFRTKAA